MGIDVLPPEDSINAYFTDTFTLTGKSILVDSIITNDPTFSLVGEYVDEQFGRITAATWTQFHSNSDNVVFKTDSNTVLTLDSLVLAINIDGYYGHYDDPLTLQIFEIEEAFPPRDSLRSNDSLAVATTELGIDFTINFSGQTNPSDLLHIRLDSSLGNKLLNAPADSLINNARFREYFKGLYLRAKQVGFNVREPGGIFAMDLLSNRTGLTIYYHADSIARNYTWNIDDDTRRFHSIHRSESSGKLLEQMLADSANPAPQYWMVEAGAFVKSYIEIPYLDQLAPAGVNRAELILNVDESYLGSDNRFVPPSALFLFRADSTHTKTNGLVGVGSYDAVTHSYTVRDPEFRLENVLMSTINGSLENDGFFIIPGSTNVTVNRVVLGGPGHPTLAPRLKVVYSNVPH